MKIEEIVVEFRNAYKTAKNTRDIETSNPASLFTNVPGLYKQAADKPTYIFAMVPGVSTEENRVVYHVVKYELD